MAKTQRTVERQVSLPSSAFTLAARSASDRVYLGFFASASSPTLVVSTKPGTTVANAAVATTGSPGYPRWELFLASHGKMVQEEWYVAPGSGIGGFSFTVIEVYEEEAGYLRTPGGLYLPDAGGPLDYITASSMNRARILERQLDQARRELKNGSAAYQ